MFTLGIPNRQYRRCTQVLGPENANPIDYETTDQGDGFYLFSFPGIDEYDFKDIVHLLKRNGITTIGADNQLSENKIMKLVDLLKEQPSPDENSLIDKLKDILERWKKPTYMGGLDMCERASQYHIDLEEDIEQYTDPVGEKYEKDKPSNKSMKGEYIQEQKLRKLIRIVIRK